MNEQVWDKAIKLYKAIWRYQLLQVTIITPEDYANMQERIGYLETYEEHMKILVDGIPNDTRTFVNQIYQFLLTYVIFQESKYEEKINVLINYISTHPQEMKLKAFQILIDANKHITKEDKLQTVSMHPPLFEINLGTDQAPDILSLPTYCNPLMTSLYSILFVLFRLFQQTEIDDADLAMAQL